MLPIKPTQESAQYPSTLSLIITALNRLVFSEKKNSIHPQFDNLENSDDKLLSNPAN